MKWQIFLTIFSTVFLAELGDKTQLATILFASDTDNSRWLVFVAAATALIAATAVGVLAGAYLSTVIDARFLNILAGVGFIGIGIWLITVT